VSLEIREDKMLLTLPARYYCRYPFEDPQGLADIGLELDLDHTAFLLVDVYGAGYDEGDPIPDYPPLLSSDLHVRAGQMIRERMRPAVEAARGLMLPVVYVENRWEPAAWGGSEFAQLVERVECGHKGSFTDLFVGTSFVSYSKVIAPREDDIVVPKTMYDGFFETTLDSVLKNLDVKFLVCAGFSAEICLLTTLIGAMYRNYRVVLLRDATLGTEFADTIGKLEMTNWAVRYCESLVGYTTTSEQFVHACHELGGQNTRALEDRWS
jgi:nicotinamidase-related amidase